MHLARRRRHRAGTPDQRRPSGLARRRHHRVRQHGHGHRGAEGRRIRFRAEAGGPRSAARARRHGVEAVAASTRPPRRASASPGGRPRCSGCAIRSRRLARSQAPIYVSGESGSGKELAARLIHEQGPRADAPFVPVNCGAIPSELMESEFFGHKKGSFTGAVADKEGLFQAASGGTLFLDEVADLPLPMQVKLLRAIQEKAVRPVGSQQESTIDVRILSATHKNLAGEVDAGTFPAGPLLPAQRHRTAGAEPARTHRRHSAARKRDSGAGWPRNTARRRRRSPTTRSRR